MKTPSPRGWGNSQSFPPKQFRNNNLVLKKEKPPTPDYYMFLEEWKIDGLTVAKGVTLKGEVIIKNDKLSLKDNAVFKDIPLKILEKYVPKPKAKIKREKKKK